MTRPTLTLLVLAGLLMGCGGNAAPSGSGPAVTAEPGNAVEVPALIADSAGTEGHAVRVSGFFLADGQTARLCEVSLESYPPQCGGRQVRIVGAVPQSVMSALSRTREPELAQATWGWVVVTGTFHATGASGEPTIELAEVILSEG